jgi:uncharacterized protein YcaQ
MAALADEDLDHEIEMIVRALEEHGPTERDELERLVGARYWGPGRFREALREAVEEGRVVRLSRNTYGPPPTARPPAGTQTGDGAGRVTVTGSRRPE